MNALTSIFPGHLLQSRQRLDVSRAAYMHHLDKNELPEDMPGWFKLQVLQQAMDMPWNRYPDLDHSGIEHKIAASMRIRGNQVLLGPGSASFINTLLNFFGMQRRQIVIAQPSYSLFDYHCRSYGIDYRPWMLNSDLEYDEGLLPELSEGAVLFIVSPNNPTGNTIPVAMLERILNNHPQVLVVLDAVYAEFEDRDHSELLRRYTNLVILRSFSKELPVAGLRLGYLCGGIGIIGTIRKLMLPFTINPLSLAFANNMLFEPDFREWAALSRSQIMAERERMSSVIQEQIPASVARVYPSSGNFLLIRVCDQERFSSVMKALSKAGVKVLDTSAMPLLENTFRVSVGSYTANCAVCECVVSVLSPSSVLVPA